MRRGVLGLRPELESNLPSWLVIDAAKGWGRTDLTELWRYRDLLYLLTWRDIAVRYKQTVLGFLWAIIQPFMAMVVFSVFLGALARVPSDGVPYPVFAYLGLLPWMYFSGVVTRGANSLVGNAHVLNRVYFPRVLLPLSATLSALVDFAISSLVLMGLMAWYGLTPAPAALFLFPLLALVTALAAAGVGMGLSALNVRYRDIQYAIPFVMQLWMFATPVVYPGSIVPIRWRSWFALNPMTGLIEAYRNAVLGKALDWDTLAVSVMSALVLVVVGVWWFERTERTFADFV